MSHLDSIQLGNPGKRRAMRMAMKLVKRNEQYSIYKRRDERYAVLNAGKQPVNGEAKTQILLEEGLIKAMVPAKPVVEASAEQAPIDDAGSEVSAASA